MESTHNPPQNIAIVGSGIAGLGLGIALQLKNQSQSTKQRWNIQLYESRTFDPSPPPSDHLLWMAPNGLKILRALGVMDSLVGKMMEQDAMHFSNSQLEPLLSLRGRVLVATHGLPIMTVRRVDLMNALTTAFLDHGGVIHYNSKVHAHRKNDKLSLKVNGADIDAALIAGCDGINSLMRREYFALNSLSHPQLFYQGLRTFLGKSVTPLAKKYQHITHEAWGYGTRFVLTSPDGETIYWSALEHWPSLEASDEAVKSQPLARLLYSFSGYHPDVTTILNAADVQSLYCCNFSEIRGLSTYAPHGLVLMGDAAHGMPPNMGQGASLALEDAYELAITLASEGISGINDWATRRKKRVDPIKVMANRMNQWFQPRSRFASKVRNALARSVPDTIFSKNAASVYHLPFHLETSEKPSGKRVEL